MPMPQEGRPDETVSGSAEDPGWLPPEINTGVAHPARVYDYMLGGKDNFAADRALADAVTAAMPSAPFMARANRAFLGRAVRYLTKEAGIRQFLDIGTGIPAAGNTHEVAQAVAPESRVVYVDNDPIVLAHARALMTSDAAGATAFIKADLRQPDRILADPVLHRTLDLAQPVALILVAIMMYVRDEENPRGIVSALLDALPSGSYLTMSHPSADFSPEEAAGAVAASERSGVSFTPRTQAEVAAFFAGLELVDPGVTPVLAWRPDGAAPADPRAVYYYGAMGRKP
jgi:hypothetical protein